MLDPTKLVSKPKGLSYREQQEWGLMEEKILQAETVLTACQAAMEDPAVISDAAALHAGCRTLDAARAEVERLYSRWAKLKEKRAQSLSTP
jgi:ATP-binding cassette subfamily F protein uup